MKHEEVLVLALQGSHSARDSTRKLRYDNGAKRKTGRALLGTNILLGKKQAVCEQGYLRPKPGMKLKGMMLQDSLQSRSEEVVQPVWQLVFTTGFPEGGCVLK